MKYCDRSPCDKLLGALGRWIFGNPGGGYTAVTGKLNQDNVRYLDSISYCPFCGTHLDQLRLGAQEIIEIDTPTH